ncbi:hypothetical protein Syun_002826 [Stephania yunnanensis]|uniref:PHD finger protein ALFIN-LIKE n=1 Tax=Stephania yunnanensis TaxID=152371 RepID=A0AAP0L3V1_9MAGN
MEGGGGAGPGPGPGLGGPNSPRTVEEVFRDFKSRRSALLKALTTGLLPTLSLPSLSLSLFFLTRLWPYLAADVDAFYQQCDPEKENLCLYGHPYGSWEVNLPVEEVPPELPEPALGINFARDGMPQKDWLSLVAVHSDAWLLAVAFYFAARLRFHKNDRKRLFQMVNDLPTVFEVVSGNVKKPSREKSTAAPASNNKSKSSTKSELQTKSSKIASPKDEEESGGEEEEDEQGATLCGACGDNYANDEFWICCDICEKWFHGKCVKITPARAEHIKQYKCPACSNKRARV